MPVPSDWDTHRMQIKREIRESQERLRQSRAAHEEFKARMAGIEAARTHAVPPESHELLEAILASLARIEGRLAEQ